MKYRLSGISETRNKRQCLPFLIPYDLTTYYYAVNMFLMLIIVKVAYIIVKLYHPFHARNMNMQILFMIKDAMTARTFFLHLTSEYDKTTFYSSYWLLRIAKS